jgi:hypothetical protein
LANSGLIWLLITLFSSYILRTLGTNRDIRYYNIISIFPIISLILAYFFQIIENLSFYRLRLATLGFGVIVLLNNSFPLALIQAWVGRYLCNDDSKKYPLSQLIYEINQTTPYLRSTLEIIPVSTPQIKELTLDYYGKLADFHVHGRKLTTELAYVNQDLQYFTGLSQEITNQNQHDKKERLNAN